MDTDKIVSLDVLDLCNILKTLGFVIKDIYKDKYVTEDCSEKYIQIKCNTSGIKVVLESKGTNCNCPEMEDNDENGKWEMSGTSGGVQVSKTQSSSAFHREFSKNTTQHIVREMANIIEMVQMKPTKITTPNKVQTNLSLSSSCLHTSPPRIAQQIKVDTPSRYRSLDTLNDAELNSVFLPEPRVLRASQKIYLADSNLDIDRDVKIVSSEKKQLTRQYTYTTSPTNSSQEPRTMPPSRTSSPVPAVPAIIMVNLHHAEKLAEDLLTVIQDSIMSSENGNFQDNKSASLVMDVSKISNIQQPVFHQQRPRSNSTASSRSAAPFSSSPNLCRIQESSKIPHTSSNKRLSLKSPSISQHDLMTSGSKNSIPKSVSTSKSISPSFGVTGNKKSAGLTPVYGSYKSLSDKSAHSDNTKQSAQFKSPNAPTNEVKPKKRNSLYSHIKSTIPRHSLSAKK